LCSEHNGAMVCRTLAVTFFCQPTPQAALPADQLIRQGHSIGSTLSGAGLVIQRQPLLEATTLSGQGFKRLSAGTVKSGTGLLIRLYRLDVETDTGSVRPYATIAEAHHPEHPGGIKSRTKQQILDGAHPERVITQAVKRMLPGNKLSRQIMTNLRVYAGSEHPHEAQDPSILDVKSMNSKNTRVTR
jgi:hypothetical protein